MKTQTYVVDQVKTRLEQLDDFEESSVRQMLNLSQQEYVSRIDMLNRELVHVRFIYFLFKTCTIIFILHSEFI